VSQKKLQISFCQNFVKFPPILIIFGKKMAKRPKLCEMYSFFISINLHYHTTVLNADVPNCYTMLKVASIRLLTHCIINSTEGATWLNNYVRLNIWSIFLEWNFAVYRSIISYVNELKTRLINEWAQFDQSIVDAAIIQWRRRLNACVCVCGAHFEHKFWQFWNELL